MNKTRTLLSCLITILALVVCSADALSNESGSSGFGNNASNQDKAEARARIHTELGAGYFGRGQYAIALQELREALKANDQYAPAYDVMGLIYMDLNEDKLAETNFHRALDISPNDPDIHNNYGWFLCNRNRFDESLKQFETALNNPLYATPESALTNAGICLVKAGKPGSARTYFESSLKFKPNQQQALMGLAQIYYDEGRLADARSLIERLLEYNQPTAQSLWLGLRVARKQNDHDTEASYGLLLRNRFPDAQETQLLLQGNYN